MSRSRLFKPRRFALLVALVATAGLLTAATAYGLTAGVTPDSQDVCSGCTATWGSAWLGQSPYDVTFHYGDGSMPGTYSGNATSHPWSHEFLPARVRRTSSISTSRTTRARLPTSTSARVSQRGTSATGPTRALLRLNTTLD